MPRKTLAVLVLRRSRTEPPAPPRPRGERNHKTSAARNFLAQLLPLANGTTLLGRFAWRAPSRSRPAPSRTELPKSGMSAERGPGRGYGGTESSDSRARLAARFAAFSAAFSAAFCAGGGAMSPLSKSVARLASTCGDAGEISGGDAWGDAGGGAHLPPLGVGHGRAGGPPHTEAAVGEDFDV